MDNTTTEHGLTRIETPAGAYFLRIEPDPSPACLARWQRALAIIQQADTDPQVLRGSVTLEDDQE